MPDIAAEYHFLATDDSGGLIQNCGSGARGK